MDNNLFEFFLILIPLFLGTSFLCRYNAFFNDETQHEEEGYEDKSGVIEYLYTKHCFVNALLIMF